MFDLLKRGRKAQMSLLAKILLVVVLFLAVFGMILYIASKFKPY